MSLKNLPRWAAIPAALVLVLGILGVGVLLEPALQAVMAQPQPTPTPEMLNYRAPQSANCIYCHVSEEALRASLGPDADISRLWILPDEVYSVHGRLGCVTCHGGNGDATDVAAAHQGLIPDPSHPREAARVCLPCHYDLRSEIPEKYIHTPHEWILKGIREGFEVCACSHCHSAVAHGPNPIASHEGLAVYCVDCHTARNVPPERLKCSGCHISPHDIELDCEVCHQSVKTWAQVRLAVHPTELTGGHAGVACFACHDKPSFRTISGYTCKDCHQRPHEFGDDTCERCHTIEGWKQ
ncbi:MAG: hypothetical protein RMK65_05970 [Anaerolineae bacterium]|nr:hypothetical protein [Anaerolineae bacterium]MDW7991676.1 hypothetical protein [Anaerolineae bacterium]